MISWDFHSANGWVEAAITATPCSAAASITRRRVSRTASHASLTDPHTLVLVSICVRNTSWATVWGPAVPFARLEDTRVWIGLQVAGAGVDQEELLLDAQRDVEIGFTQGHSGKTRLVANSVKAVHTG